MEKTTLYLPDDLLATYSELSRRQHRSTEEIMRDALREYAASQMDERPEEYQLPGWIGMVETNGEVNSTNVKDWLREHWTPG
jgi:metal-responsive CopG/Arc/MetJ family transcriptional regulator